ncbi:MAG: hypothetical protein Q9M28_03525 [Mariprofundaceae bacterium]|nr:hypothetical protein [Mariprofundaceae bacterium]
MGIKIALIALGAIFILAVVGGFYKMQQDREKSFQQTIGVLQQQVSDMTAENNALRDTNASLNASVQRKNEERQEIQRELEKMRLVDAQTQQQILDVEKKLQDAERNKRMKQIRNSKKASLFLRIVNKNVACETEHMEDEGKCRAGRWQPAKKKAQQTVKDKTKASVTPIKVHTTEGK